MKKDKEKTLNKGLINKLVNLIQTNTDKLYKDTYFSNVNNVKDLDGIKQDISDSIDNIINNNEDSYGIKNISKLYTRLLDKKSIETDAGIEDLFNDKALTDNILLSFTENKNIVEYDREIDLILKYMPSLTDALDAKKDNVLSADQFSKDFINIVNKSDLSQSGEFAQNIHYLKQKYNLLELFENIYDNTATYGEEYIYICPYNEAISNLLNNSSNSITESVKISINESANISKDANVHIKIQKSAIIESCVEPYRKKYINEQKFNDKLINDDLSFEGLDDTFSDGFIDNNKTKQKLKNINGCIVKRLPRQNVKPLYLDNICMGYYYLEVDQAQSEAILNNNQTNHVGTDPLSKIKFNSTIEKNNEKNVLTTISSKLAKYIDANFVNNNEDLKDEIYTILKYNNFYKDGNVGNINVTFIKPENLEHVYFKMDQKTHRGISDLDRALIPAKLFICLYVTGALGILTRGNDKRVYYVRQTVDTNIAKTLLNTVNQIKKSNFGARELSNLKNVLSILGRYQDLLIPKGASGESPIDFEVMPAQAIDIHQELLDILEQMAVNSTDVPFEYVQSRKNVDYAVRLTMSCAKFLKKVYKRQAIIKYHYNNIINRLYKYEFDSNITLEINLSTPSFLSTLNANQLMQNLSEYSQFVSEMKFTQEEDEIANIFKSKFKRNMIGTYLDLNLIDNLAKEAEMEYKMKKSQDEDM